MLVRGIEMMQEIVKVPIHTFYTPSNHDEMCGYHALKYLEAWFRKDPNVEIDISAYPRKYQLTAKRLLDIATEIKKTQTAKKEKAFVLRRLCRLKQSVLWAQADFNEMHGITAQRTDDTRNQRLLSSAEYHLLQATRGTRKAAISERFAKHRRLYMTKNADWCR